jgi:hypothetical protein
MLVYNKRIGLMIVSTYQKSTVDVREEVFLRPFKTICVVLVTVVGTADVVFPVCPPESIDGRDWAPVLRQN